jgi:hypothetical protein
MIAGCLSSPAWRAIIILAATAAGGEPLLCQQTFVGAESCASCHRQEHAAQSVSGHARSLSPAANHALAGSFDSSGVSTPPYRFEYKRTPQELRVRAFDAENVMDIPLEWAFGAGEQAVTFVTRVNEDWYLEHSRSYYPGAQGFASTPGQAELKPADLSEAMGVLYRTLDPRTGILGCFECHSTGPVARETGNELRPSELGVRCEACHGPGSDHAAAGDPALVGNPARLDANAQNEFCGKCHRPPAAATEKPDWNYAWNVRHQPLYLAESACFNRSDGALSCLSCHHPHEAARNFDAAFYNAKCAGCHQEGRRPPSDACRVSQPSNCIGCHMPRVSPQPFLRFTNHWIGVYGDGAKLQPVR